MNLVRILAILTVATSAGSAAADALKDATDAIHRKDYATAVRLLEPQARNGDPVAQLRFGLLHYHGHGVREDNRVAAEWFRRAAGAGLAEAQFQLANMYAYGLAPPAEGEDAQRQAATWYFAAARQGHAEAQYSLAVMFLTGSGVEASAEEALKWMKRAASQGHADARLYLQGP